MPSAENISYNQLKWNDDANHYKSSYKVKVGEVEYDEDQKSTGKVEIDLNSVLSDSECFYGGLYKVNLMYERTKTLIRENTLQQYISAKNIRHLMPFKELVGVI